MNIEHIYGFFDDTESIVGFICMQNQKNEMLFIDSEIQGQGKGSRLIGLAINDSNAKYVDVYEQSTQAVNFYEDRGFKVINRSELDYHIRPFPILHMKKY
ncbi:MAG: GNAT family N-acetyltransferase [Erysipelotrichales bacterium]|nr:GNAT family N-acetyltransferase [Erysipelotrichales bacterium]